MTHADAFMPWPKAVLSVSAHWHVPQCAVTLSSFPLTNHDFEGFSRKLYEVQYPAPGSPDFARRVNAFFHQSQLHSTKAEGWTRNLAGAFPDADVPVVQLSIIDETQPRRFRHEIGKRSCTTPRRSGSRMRTRIEIADPH